MFGCVCYVVTTNTGVYSSLFESSSLLPSPTIYKSPGYSRCCTPYISSPKIGSMVFKVDHNVDFISDTASSVSSLIELISCLCYGVPQIWLTSTHVFGNLHQYLCLQRRGLGWDIRGRSFLVGAYGTYRTVTNLFNMR